MKSPFSGKYTLDDVAGKLNIHRASVLRALEIRNYTGGKEKIFGKYWLFDAADIDEFAKTYDKTMQVHKRRKYQGGWGNGQLPGTDPTTPAKTAKNKGYAAIRAAQARIEDRE